MLYEYKDYLRISKPMAKKLYTQEPDEDIIIVPCNMTPDNECGTSMIMTKNSDFDKITRDFEIYNCTSRQTGLYAAFFVKDYKNDKQTP